MISIEDYQDIVGNRIKVARLEKGLSQQQLADLLNANVMQVSRWENGRNMMHLYNAIWISKVLDKSLDYLFGA